MASGKNKAGIIFLGIGILFFGAALGWYIHNLSEDRRALEVAVEVSDKVMDRFRSDEIEFHKVTKEYLLEHTQELKSVDIDGHQYVGLVSIPSVELEMAVLDICNEDNLHVSSCRYYGSPFTNDLVIAGHNYKSGFGKLSELKRGDEVFFTDMEGTVFGYEVEDIEILDGTSIEQMINSEFDLTLYTCTYGGKQRVTVRCSMLSE